jgi:hypothetical protein
MTLPFWLSLSSVLIADFRRHNNMIPTYTAIVKNEWWASWRGNTTVVWTSPQCDEPRVRWMQGVTNPVLVQTYH